MIESFACGTPVIAFRGGSVDEIVDEGVTGFIVEDLDAAVAAVDRIDSVDRRGCRERFERRFTDWRMASEYVRIYRRVIERSTSSNRVA
jgi:glycosyltransferase involved in cell wall biosynthesis